MLEIIIKKHKLTKYNTLYYDVDNINSDLQYIYLFRIYKYSIYNIKMYTYLHKCTLFLEL